MFESIITDCKELEQVVAITFSLTYQIIKMMIC